MNIIRQKIIFKKNPESAIRTFVLLLFSGIFFTACQQNGIAENIEAEGNPRLTLTFALADTGAGTAHVGANVSASILSTSSTSIQGTPLLALKGEKLAATTDNNGNFSIVTFTGRRLRISATASGGADLGSFEINLPKMSRNAATGYKPIVEAPAANLTVTAIATNVNVDEAFTPPSELPTNTTVAVASVGIGPLNPSLSVGGTQQMTYSITPGNATNQNVTWSTDAPAVATVDASGLVTANSNGTANITVTTVDGSFTSSTAVTVTTPDTTPPTPGTAISFVNVQSTSMTIDWGAASDNVTSPANLTYRLVKDVSAAGIDTIAEVDGKTGADLLLDYSANTLTANATGLTSATTYHFAVVVKDEAGNQTLYGPASQATSTPVIRIYTDSTSRNGNLGNRATSTGTCQTMQTTSYPAFNCSNYLAVVSYSGDAIGDFTTTHSLPASMPVWSHNDSEVAVNWNDLVNGPTITLQAAGVANPSPTPYFWSFSSSGGLWNSPQSCNDATDGTNSFTGAQAAISSTAAAWISFAVNQPCDGSTNQAYLMCICW